MAGNYAIVATGKGGTGTCLRPEMDGLLRHRDAEDGYTGGKSISSWLGVTDSSPETTLPGKRTNGDGRKGYEKIPSDPRASHWRAKIFTKIILRGRQKWILHKRPPVLGCVIVERTRTIFQRGSLLRSEWIVKRNYLHTRISIL